MYVSTTFKGNSEYSSEDKLIYPAATRNQEPILQVLKQFIKHDKTKEHCYFVEIASGSGQHVFHFAPQFPWITFQPTEYDKSLLGSIAYYANACKSNNIKPPKLVDICKDLSEYGFEKGSIDYIYNANMIHISPFECSIGLYKNAGIYLRKGGIMFTYGPYSKDGVLTPQSNVAFNESLKARDPTWGIRDIRDLKQLARENNLHLHETVDMPANNKTLIWIKQ